MFGKDSKETKCPEILFTLKASLGLERQELAGLKKKCLYLPYIRLYITYCSTRRQEIKQAGIFFVMEFFFRPWHEYFLGLFGVHEVFFFSLNFSLREYFFCTSPLPPPPLDKFSDGPSLRSPALNYVRRDMFVPSKPSARSHPSRKLSKRFHVSGNQICQGPTSSVC